MSGLYPPVRDFKTTASKDAFEQHMDTETQVREYLVAVEQVKIMQAKLRHCYESTGPNHFEDCKELRDALWEKINTPNYGAPGPERSVRRHHRALAPSPARARLLTPAPLHRRACAYPTNQRVACTVMCRRRNTGSIPTTSAAARAKDIIGAATRGRLLRCCCFHQAILTIPSSERTGACTRISAGRQSPWLSVRCVYRVALAKIGDVHAAPRRLVHLMHAECIPMLYWTFAPGPGAETPVALAAKQGAVCRSNVLCGRRLQ
jgi:hypothetical protein